jgi:hypothetical protein
MPVLSRFSEPFRQMARVPDSDPEITRGVVEVTRSGLLSTCANLRCTSGWLKAWRSRTTPIFETGWCCSPACTTAQVARALRREIEMMGDAQNAHRHRIPLGLVMMERGWITGMQLRGALEAQRAAGAGRIGHWLIHQQGVDEHLVTRALGLQWRCPVLDLDGHEPESMAAFLPRFFVDAFGALPLRSVAGKLLYMGFEERIDPVLALAVERMTDMRVESGLVRDSLFRRAHSRMLEAKFPGVELIEAVSEQVLVQDLARRIERTRPMDCRLVRVHDCFWMRLWKLPARGPRPEVDGVEDLICSLHARL